MLMTLYPMPKLGTMETHCQLTALVLILRIKFRFDFPYI